MTIKRLDGPSGWQQESSAESSKRTGDPSNDIVVHDPSEPKARRASAASNNLPRKSIGSIGTHSSHLDNWSFRVPSPRADSPDGTKTFPPLGWAIDPYSGELDFKALKDAAKRMGDMLPPVPAGASKTFRDKHAAMVKEIKAIEKLARASRASAVAAFNAANEDGAVAPQGAVLSASLPLEERVRIGRTVREHYAKAATLATWMREHAPTSGDARTFELLAAVMRGMKRRHLTENVAPLDMALYASKEAGNIEKVAPGMSTGKPGALLVTNVGVAATGGVGALSVGGAGNTGQVLLKDDDGAVLYFDTVAGNASVTAGFDKIATLAGRGGSTAAPGFVVDTSVDGVIRHNVTKEANRQGGGSASAAASELRYTWQNWKALAKMLLGRSYAPTGGAPTYASDAKLSKGARTSMLHRAAGMLDVSMGGPALGKTPDRWSRIVNEYYPSVPRLVEESLKDGRPLPRGSALDATTPPPLALANRALAMVNPFAQLEAAIGVKHAKDELPNGVGASATAGGDVLNVHVRSPRMAHEVMDWGLVKDPAQAFRLVEDYDAALHADPDVARLQLYAGVKSALESLDGGQPAPDVFYGDSIPVQFYGAMNQPGGHRLNAVTQQCEHLAELAAALPVHGETFSEPADRSAPSLRKPHASDRARAFREINEKIWGARYSDTTGALLSGGYPGGLRKALKDPDKFLARSHDAISIALGLAENHLSVNKRQIVRLGIPGQEDAIAAADTAYLKTREVLNKHFLSLRKDQIVAKHSSVGSTLVFNRIHGTASVTLSGGAEPGLIGRMAPGAAQDITLGSSLLQGVASARVQTRIANRQVLDPRLGFDTEIQLTLEAGVPLAIDAAREIVLRGLKQTGIDATSAAGQAMDVKHVLSEALGQLSGTRTGGLALNVMFRQPPHGDGKSIELAYIRLSESGTGGMSASPSVPGTGNSVKGSVFELKRGVLLEVLGPDLGYVSMHHGDLVGAIDKSRAELEAAVTITGKGKGKAASPSFSEAAAHAFTHDDYLRNRYFGKGDTIMKVLEKHLDCLHAIKTGNLPAPGQTQPNEFFRYYTDDAFKRARLVANEAAHHAPGSSAGGKDAFDTPNPLKTMEGALALRGTDGKEHFDTTSAQWQALKAQVAALKTPAERVRYFTQSSNGTQLLESFVKIMSNVQDTWLATLNHADKTRPAGFAAHVKHDRLKPKTEKPVTKPAAGDVIGSGASGGTPTSPAGGGVISSAPPTLEVSDASVDDWKNELIAELSKVLGS